MTHEESIRSLVGESAQAFEEHSGRIEALLDRVQSKFDNDHTGFSAGLGAALIISAVVLAILGRAETLSIMLAVMGGLLFIAALVMRAFTNDRQVKRAETLIILERERAKLKTRTAVLKHIWLYEQPQNLDFQQLRILIDEPAPNQLPETHAIATSY